MIASRGFQRPIRAVPGQPRNLQACLLARRGKNLFKLGATFNRIMEIMEFPPPPFRISCLNEIPTGTTCLGLFEPLPGSSQHLCRVLRRFQTFSLPRCYICTNFIVPQCWDRRVLPMGGLQVPCWKMRYLCHRTSGKDLPSFNPLSLTD